jgi:hypothetical protein
VHMTLPEHFVFKAGQMFFHEGHLQEVRLSGSMDEQGWSTQTPPKIMANAERKLPDSIGFSGNITSR